MSNIPTPEELWAYFQEVGYVDEHGNIPVHGCPRIVGSKHIKKGHPDYTAGSVTYATQEEIDRYVIITLTDGEQAARDWLTKRWHGDE